MASTGEVSARIGVVYTEWNELVTKQLLEGALDTLDSAGIESITVVQVPGSWEIPLTIKALLEKDCDGAVALGCILQGATHHAQQLASDVSGALMRLQLEVGKPISWGILTPEDLNQALDRAGLKMGNKGREAANSLLDMLQVLDQIRAE
ncbi:MAG: 6,7-dimethyl-8-ribityllumazine synthase [Armatimonadetes bacterium]|nr:6,7-dimethyl-8-ribityllumazine synthase [Armatimonadota bacterium]